MAILYKQIACFLLIICFAYLMKIKLPSRDSENKWLCYSVGLVLHWNKHRWNLFAFQESMTKWSIWSMRCSLNEQIICCCCFFNYLLRLPHKILESLSYHHETRKCRGHVTMKSNTDGIHSFSNNHAKFGLNINTILFHFNHSFYFLESEI